MSGKGTRETPVRRRLVPLPVYTVVAGIVLVGIAVGAYFLFSGKGDSNGPAAVTGDLKAAQDAYAAADYGRAAEIYRDIAESDPADVDVLRSLARTLAADGKADEAIAQYLAIVELAPDDAVSLYELATLEQLMGKTPDAIAHYEAAIDVTPDPAYLKALAPVYSQLGKWAESIATWEQYLAVAPLDERGKAHVYSEIARAYDNARDYQKAKENLEKALALDPNNEDYRSRLEAYGG